MSNISIKQSWQRAIDPVFFFFLCLYVELRATPKILDLLVLQQLCADVEDKKAWPRASKVHIVQQW